jgi:hypothetical protein
MWSRNILESFVNDDGELTDAALDSSLAEFDIVVEGGDYGSPYILGNYGFYSKTQFDQQSKVLEVHERKVVEKNQLYFLSGREWTYVDARLGRYSKFGNARMEKATRGDSLIMLASREAAFEVASVMITRGVDPLLR